MAHPAHAMRRLYALAAIALATFTLYSSTVPFDFSALPMDIAWERFRDRAIVADWSRLSRTDALANALLFVPFGFVLTGALIAGRRSRLGKWLAPPVALTIAVAVSSLAEFLQIFLSERIPSNSDIAAQFAGAALGVSIWLVAGDAMSTWLHDTVTARRDDRLSRLLLGYAIAWTFVSLAPFDITVDIGDLAARVRSGQVALLPPGGEVNAWDVFVEVLSAVPLGAFFVSWTGRQMLALAHAAIWIGCVEAGQVFVMSHSAMGLDAILGIAGASIGLLARRRLDAVVTPEPESDGTSVYLPGLAFTLLWCAVLAAYHWRPYAFTFDEDAIRSKLASMSLIPFAAYRAGSYLNALSDFVTKMALALPLGIAIGLAVRRPMTGPLVLMSMVLASAFFGMLEAGQFLLPARYPDITDVLIGLGGTLSGVVIVRWLIGVRDAM